MPPRAVTLNVDLGELPDEPDALYAIATQVNVACGGHAGDASSMRRACRSARTSHARIAAHPSYPDREGFGRRPMAIDARALRASIAEQCRALAEAAASEWAEVTCVKAHGALYHAATEDEAIARATIEGAREGLGRTVAMVGAPSGRLRALVEAEGGAYLVEGFADRAYDGDRLRPRAAPGALLVEPAAAAKQAMELARRGAFDTLCVHGDTPGALAIARAVRAALEGAVLLR